ncbi:MAG: glycosyltransferase, partial [Alphaproteobacteria bacterium]
AALRPLAASLNASWEVIVVDDASGDHTPAALRGVATAVPELRVLRHRRQSGQSAGLLTGIRAARGVWIATLDGDGQNDPADIPALWRALQAVPVGARPLALIAGHRTARRHSAIRRLSSRMANGVRRRILQDDTPDTGCGLKLFARDAFMALPHFDHMHRFLPALVQRAGGQSHSVPVNHRPRGGGRSHYGIANRLWVGIVDLMGVAWLLRRQRLPGPIEEMNRSENRP